MGEKQYAVAGNITVTVSDVHRFGTDAVLLADFANPKVRDVACDMGTGCGIIPLIWCRKPYPKKITAIDIQPDACELVKKSAEISGVQDRLRVVCRDIRELAKAAAGGEYSLVTMNPPYQKLNSGILSFKDGEKLTRHETACTLEDAAFAASRLLNFAGRFCVCHKPERLADVFSAMRGAGIEPKRMRFVAQRRGSVPWLVLVEGKKGSKPFLTVMPELIVEDENGEPTEQIEEIYSFYREMKK